MALLSPCPRYSPRAKCPALPSGQSLDYSITSPLDANAPLCKHTVPYATPSETWTAGQSITVTFEGSATHNGGHCQWSISYDGGKTFVVLYEELQYCFYTGNPTSGGQPTVKEYTIKLPSDLPSSNSAVFAWTWVNASGNREFYMNCADVVIQGTSASSYTGKQMTILNHAGYTFIPEFQGNYSTGLEYYTGASEITVNVAGGGSSGSSDTGSSASAGDQYSSTPADTSEYDSTTQPDIDYNSAKIAANDNYYDSSSAEQQVSSAPPLNIQTTGYPAAYAHASPETELDLTSASASASASTAEEKDAYDVINLTTAKGLPSQWEYEDAEYSTANPNSDDDCDESNDDDYDDCEDETDNNNNENYGGAYSTANAESGNTNVAADENAAVSITEIVKDIPADVEENLMNALYQFVSNAINKGLAKSN
ncbi:hypothetical protein H4217_001551 [Coemansia sp. RSA 1939]|nr:hypothetical protein H4217_001551 [Coemansia sp. RSA 1939]KAJ2615833.1 hypothetical protein EV177_001364 [Coemansia sp. RSA 1804]